MPVRRSKWASGVMTPIRGGGAPFVPVQTNVSPIAAFTAVVAGLNVTVNASASSDPDGTTLTYSWNWGDGSPAATGVSASRTYPSTGDKTITLTVTDAEGAQSSVTQTLHLGTGNLAPTAIFSATPTGLSVNVTAAASSDPDGTITQYRWDWGDSTSNIVASTAAAGHTYLASGAYTITLTVTDNGGATATTSRTVTVYSGTDPIALREALPDTGEDPAGGTDPLDPTKPKLYTIDASKTGLLPGWTADMLTVDTRSSFSTNNGTQVVIRNARFVNYVTLTGRNYKYKNCQFDKGIMLRNPNVQAIEFEDCHIELADTNTTGPGIDGHDYTLRRVYITGTEDGIRPYKDKTTTSQSAASQLANLNVNVIGSFVEKLLYHSPDSAVGGNQGDNRTHCDVVQLWGGSGITFLHSRLDGTIDPTKGDASDPNVGGGAGSSSHVSGNPFYPKMPSESVFMFSPLTTPIAPEIRIERCAIGGGVVMFNFGSHTSATGLSLIDNRLTIRPINGSTTNPQVVAWNSGNFSSSGRVASGNRWAYAGDGHTLGQLYTF